jgi:molybdopterin-guanine dinucleotide biosynthesis protein
MSATRIAISGFSSGVGKTTLMCDLLARFPGWEAIKISRGHFRSCGKNPEACCISPLLGEEPRVISGRFTTFSPNKDTGRYWEAGAGNVHWVICTNDQVEKGVEAALEQVKADGVFIEGTSFLKYFPVDYSVMVISPSTGEIKSSAARIMEKIDAVFVADSLSGRQDLSEIRHRLRKRGGDVGEIPIFYEADLAQLSDRITQIHRDRTAS